MQTDSSDWQCTLNAGLTWQGCTCTIKVNIVTVETLEICIKSTYLPHQENNQKTFEYYVQEVEQNFVNLLNEVLF